MQDTESLSGVQALGSSGPSLHAGCKARLGRFQCDREFGHFGQHRSYFDVIDEAVFWGSSMIQIRQSPTADTRTCDYANVTKETLRASSQQHIADVRKALDFFMARVCEAGQRHDPDKLTDLDGFHADFVTGFKQTGWWDRHRKLNRHHLNQDDGIPADVNLIDVLDFIADCVMAGMARSGSVYPLNLPPELLERAFQNTVELLKANVTVESSRVEG